MPALAQSSYLAAAPPAGQSLPGAFERTEARVQHMTANHVYSDSRIALIHCDFGRTRPDRQSAVILGLFPGRKTWHNAAACGERWGKMRNRRTGLQISRRQALSAGAAAAALAAVPAMAEDLPSARRLPRWRGFNLLEKFTLEGNRPYREADFDFLAAHGFNYVRLPLDYRIWTTPDGDWREPPIREIDQAVNFAVRRGLHITLCLHRAPGYCVNPPVEARNLWGEGAESDLARLLFAEQWQRFAVRYRGISSRWLSFNLVNEPPDVSEEAYMKVAIVAVAAIYSEDPHRLVIADGRSGGFKPTPALASLGIAQAVRGYEPFHLTHYRAPWVNGSDAWALPTWPLQTDAGTVDKNWLWRTQIEPWKALEKQGVGVFIGEWGVYNRTPHDVALAWMRDCLENWRQAGWGWCLWNLRGAFGPLDSQRADVVYERNHDSFVDRQMLDLLIRG